MSTESSPKKTPLQCFALKATRFFQALVGLGVALLALTKLVLEAYTFFTSHAILPFHWMDDLHYLGLLDLVAEGLLASAALELAHMLITPDLDEAVDPLILGLAATIVFRIEIARTAPDVINQAVQILLYILALGSLFVIRHIFIHRLWLRGERRIVTNDD